MMMLNLLNLIKNKIDIYFVQEENKRMQKNLSEFSNNVSRQSDQDFVEKCFEKACQKKMTIALSIRNAIANLGNIQPEFIHAESSFEELDLLSFWECCGDAGFDTILFVEAIEKELNLKLTDKQLQSCSVQDPDLNIKLKICDFVQDFYRWYDHNIDI